MKINNTVKKLCLLATMVLSGICSFAQNIDVGVQLNEYAPQTFPGYPSNGTYTAVIYRSGVAPIPANTLFAVVTLAPQVAWNGQAVTVPAGWTLDVGNSTTTNVVFLLTQDWIDNDADAIFQIPVTATAARSVNDNIVSAQVQFPVSATWNDPDPNNNSLVGNVHVTDNNLPVKLISFKANAEGRQVNLKWSTSEEVNSDHFEVQHSTDAKQWKAIGQVASYGQDTKQTNSYSFVHPSPVKGLNYYRLKMVDRDNTFAMSSVDAVRIENSDAGLYTYPNPASEKVRIANLDIADVKQLELIDVNGKVVYLNQKVTSDVINTSGLSTGIYLLKVTATDGISSSRKLIINR